METNLTNTEPNNNLKYKVLYIYFSFDSFCKAMDSWSLKASQSHDVNDPMENKAKNSNKVTPETFPFFCMSEIMSNDAMWGSYADRGRGICLAFCFPTEQEEGHGVHDSFELSIAPGRTAKFRTIQYQNERPSVQNNAEALTYKGKYWAYEKEIRCFTTYETASHSKDNMLFFRWPMRYLAGAIIGPNCPCTPGFIKQKMRLAYKNHLSSIAIDSSADDLTNGKSCLFPDTRAESINYIVEKATIDEKAYSLNANLWSNSIYVTPNDLMK